MVHKLATDVINIINDIKKCQMYIYKIKSGNYLNLNEVLQFTNEKYKEICITDAELILENKIVSKLILIDNDIMNRVLDNLDCINRLLIAKLEKEIIRK